MPTETAAKVIQSHFRRLIKRRDFVKILNAASLLQTVFHAWLIVRKKPSCVNCTAIHDRESSNGNFSFSMICEYPLSL